MNKLGKNEKYIDIKIPNKKGKIIKTIRRIGKLVHYDKYTKSKYKYKVRIAPRTYLYMESF